MATHDSNDAIVTRDRGGRRRFMQRGVTVIAAGAAIVSTRHALASDCDQYSGEESARCSDSDASSNAGSGGDPAVCGCPPSSEVPARYESDDEASDLRPKVVRVR